LRLLEDKAEKEAKEEAAREDTQNPRPPTLTLTLIGGLEDPPKGCEGEGD